jgi:methyl-accepting chemotaxis protein
MASADLPPALKADIAQKLEKYQADFSAWAAGAQEAALHGAAMSKEFHEIEPVIADIQQSVDRLYKQACLIHIRRSRIRTAFSGP